MGAFDIVQQLEFLRNKINFFNAFAAGGMLIGFFCAFIFMNPFVAFMCMFGGIIISMGGAKYRKEFNLLYKDTFVKTVLSEIFDNVTYEWQHGFFENYVRDFSLCQMGNRFTSEDYLRASYKGVFFEQADVHVWYKSSGKNSHSTTYFKGRMFVFDLPIKQVFSLKIYTENFMYRAKKTDGIKLHNIEMESTQFNKKFDVLAAREHDAFYVLTPQVMERFQGIANNFGNIALHFHGGKLFVGINCSGNAFDSSMNKKIDYLAEQTKAKRDVQVIIDIIDSLSDMMQNYDESEEKTVALYDETNIDNMYNQEGCNTYTNGAYTQQQMQN